MCVVHVTKRLRHLAILPNTNVFTRVTNLTFAIHAIKDLVPAAILPNTNAFTQVADPMCVLHATRRLLNWALLTNTFVSTRVTNIMFVIGSRVTKRLAHLATLPDKDFVTQINTAVCIHYSDSDFVNNILTLGLLMFRCVIDMIDSLVVEKA